MEQGILSLLVSNHFGVLTKVTGLFSRRGFNIKALSVGETENKEFSRITILTEGNSAQLEQIYKQVSKLEEVKAVKILPNNRLMERELMLVKVATQSKNADLQRLCAEYSAKITSVSQDCTIIEASGSMFKIDRLIEQIKPLGILELSRTGITALELCRNTLSEEYTDAAAFN
ncbi:acetolactate synthase small subunit [Hydrogenoanaerobacterium saccharovorans]|uniref:Acetolactate synthase small subunit n=1 Tax=Hydrogenoanaerobacterium saccharovorans TaxID=474960 RepID=A0A1H7YUL2_9FIRM|nr:acetolactate synthase small subunit [Hydrogenoanaerobacterium saccharovorans]RPF49051.1 acetolactate synthase small subunit [Hydrogenoanaerobacterium saccharovorans]SEM48839.1 acetolactate synthase, small subunit [Hydrogenoanaerobacterium saccharovorans]